MPYRLRKREPLADALRRIAREQCERAAEALHAAATDAQVHEARVRIKRVRAVLAMLRGSMPGARGESDALAQAARALAAPRDAASMSECFKTLRDRFGALDPPAFDRIAHALADRAAVARGVGPASITLARTTLLGAARRAPGWTIHPSGFGAIRAGLERTYRRARRGRARALASDDPRVRHAWRIGVKRLGEQIRVLERIWPEALTPQADLLSDIAQRLGVDHDLGLLAALLRRTPDAFGEAPRVLAIARLGERVAREQVRACRRPARQALGEKAGAFVARIEAWWEAWRR